MTFKQFKDRLSKRFWWILVLLVIFNAAGFSWIQAQKYTSLYSFRLSLDQSFYEIQTLSQYTPNNLVLSENSLASSYTLNSGFMTKYFQEFLVSGQSINKLKNLGVLPQMTVSEKPTFVISLLGNSILEIKNEFNSQDDAQQFNQALSTVISDEVKAWNIDKPKMLQISSDSGQSTVSSISKPLQTKILPSLAAIIFGLALILLVPTINLKNSKI